MNGRGYLSIGDVLTLLRQEFPDITISKIRFLESQGLVNPERTPSGYRKFYEHDVERLRSVLRMQREHFLPLKVIKGRLEGEGDPAAGPVAAGADPELVGAGHIEREAFLAGGSARRPGVRAGAGGANGGPPLPGFEASDDTGSAAGGVSAATDAGVPARPLVPAGRTAVEVGTAGNEPGVPEVASAAGHGGAVPDPRAAPGTRRAHRMVPATPGTGAPGGTATAPSTGVTRPEVGGSGAAPSGTVGAESPAGPTAGEPSGVSFGPLVPGTDLSGASLTAEELAAAAGLSVEAVGELVSYGLLAGRAVGGVTCYDEDDLTVARVAAGFARFGVEARHLRLHKHAAEREAGFIEQVVLPLLKQRNPEARRRAQEVVAELARLGQSLRGTLVRRALRDHLGR